MTDIYDRALWPSPESNPVIQLLTRDDDWFSNAELVEALGLAPRRALMSMGTIFSRQIDSLDSAIVDRNYLTPGVGVNRANGGTMRVFNRRALIIAAMRTETINAAAFRDWLASRAAEVLGDE